MSRGFTWEDEIAVAVLVRQDLQVADTVPLWEYDFPRVAATQEDVRDAERALGFALDEQVREFLLRADGWESFYQDVDLFGTPEFRGAGHWGIAHDYLDEAEAAGVLASSGLEKKDVLPIAACDEQSDLFLMVRPTAQQPGRVLWLAGDLIDEFPTFEEYFLAMVDYTRYSLKRLTSRNQH